MVLKILIGSLRDSVERYRTQCPEYHSNLEVLGHRESGYGAMLMRL